MNKPTPRTMGSRPPTSGPVEDIDPGARPGAAPSFLPAADTPIGDAPGAASPADRWNGQLHLPQGLDRRMVPPDRARDIVAQVEASSLHDLSLMQVAGLASEPEIALHRSLGAFLDRIDKSESPQIFRLVSELNAAVRSEDLDGLADKILDGKPGLLDRLIGLLSPKKLAAARAALVEDLQQLVAGKSRKLSGVLAKMEARIETEKQKALDEARTLERLKDDYRVQFDRFVLAAVFLATLLAKARQELADIERAAARGDDGGRMTLQEARDKVQALESRALAVEGVMTKLPAEQLVIRQVQTATIQTVQEVTTTTAGRLASIKMTLLTLHGAMGVRNLQRTAQQGADLDANLNRVRDRLVADVAATAARAPGDNRLAQARQIQDVTRHVRELAAVAEKARIDNQAKFDEARALLAGARDELARLGATIRPDRPLDP